MNISYFLRQVRKADRSLSTEVERMKWAAVAAFEWFQENVDNTELKFCVLDTEFCVYKDAEYLSISVIDKEENREIIIAIRKYEGETPHIANCTDLGGEFLEYFAEVGTGDLDLL